MAVKKKTVSILESLNSIYAHILLHILDGYCISCHLLLGSVEMISSIWNIRFCNSVKGTKSRHSSARIEHHSNSFMYL